MTEETALSIANLIREILAEFKLDPLKLFSICADNTNTNFGGVSRHGSNNVFVILKKG